MSVVWRRTMCDARWNLHCEMLNVGQSTSYALVSFAKLLLKTLWTNPMAQALRF